MKRLFVIVLMLGLFVSSSFGQRWERKYYKYIDKSLIPTQYIKTIDSCYEIINHHEKYDEKLRKKTSRDLGYILPDEFEKYYNDALIKAANSGVVEGDSVYILKLEAYYQKNDQNSKDGEYNFIKSDLDSLLVLFFSIKNKSLAINNKNKITWSIGSTYIDTKHPEIALENLKKYITYDSLYYSEIPDSSLIKFYNSTWSLYQTYFKDYGSAINSMSKAIDIAEKNMEDSLRFELYYSMSQSFEMLEDYQNMLDYWKKSNMSFFKYNHERFVRSMVALEKVDSLIIFFSEKGIEVTENDYAFAKYFIFKGDYRKALISYKQEFLRSKLIGFNANVNNEIVPTYIDFGIKLIELPDDSLLSTYKPNNGDISFVRLEILDSLYSLTHDFYNTFCKGNPYNEILGKLRLAKIEYLYGYYMKDYFNEVHNINVNYSYDQYEKALSLAQNAFMNLDDNSPVEVRKDTYENLYKIYKALGHSDHALSFHEEYISCLNEINEKNNSDLIGKKLAASEFNKQMALEKEEHKKQLAIEAEEKQKQQIITYSISVGLALIIIFSIIIFRRLQVTRKQKVQIEHQSAELSEANEELNQQNEEISAQRDEIEVQKHKVEEAHNEVQASINYAKRIQNAILPAPSVIKEHLPESFVLYKPKDVVAGDFYWLEQVVNTTLFAAADCTGHGVPGAMVSVVCHNAMNRAVREFGLTDPGLILDKTREIVVHEFEKSEDDVKDGMDIALCSLNGNKLQYAGAHNPLWIVRNGEILETKADKQPIGKFDKPTSYVTHTIELQKEDSVYIFSDGFADQFGGEKDKKFGSKQFKNLLISIQNKSMNEQKEILNSEFQNWISKGSDEQIDDVCVFGVKI